MGPQFNGHIIKPIPICYYSANSAGGSRRASREKPAARVVVESSPVEEPKESLPAEEPSPVADAEAENGIEIEKEPELEPEVEAEKLGETQEGNKKEAGEMHMDLRVAPKNVVAAAIARKTRKVSVTREVQTEKQKRTPKRGGKKEPKKEKEKLNKRNAKARRRGSNNSQQDSKEGQEEVDQILEQLEDKKEDEPMQDQERKPAPAQPPKENVQTETLDEDFFEAGNDANKKPVVEPPKQKKKEESRSQKEKDEDVDFIDQPVEAVRKKPEPQAAERKENAEHKRKEQKPVKVKEHDKAKEHEKEKDESGSENDSLDADYSKAYAAAITGGKHKSSSKQSKEYRNLFEKLKKR